MKLIRGLHNLTQTLAASVVTIGNYDGMHLGHQHLLQQLKKQARKLQVPSVVIIFEPQPLEYFKQRQAVPRLMRFPEKYLALQQQGIDYLCCLYFDKELAALSAENFVKNILIEKLGMRAMVVGYDFRFGAKRQGDFSLLKKMAKQFNFAVAEMPPVKVSGAIVSSTRLREALSQGDLSLAYVLLGRHYSLYGKVTHGHQRGRDLGFPTANINLHRELVPMSGVFVIRARLRNELLNGVANIGVRPTFAGARILLEVHLFNFNRHIYGSHLEVEFLHRLREEKRFNHFSELVQQIGVDVQNAKKYLQEHLEK